MFYCPRLYCALTRLFPLTGFQIITEPSSPEDLPCLERDKRSIRQRNHRRFCLNSNENRKLFCRSWEAPPGAISQSAVHRRRPSTVAATLEERQPVRHSSGPGGHGSLRRRFGQSRFRALSTARTEANSILVSTPAPQQLLPFSPLS